MQDETAVLVFKDTEFDVVDIHNVPWLRGYQIGSALEYSDGGAAIAKIYDRNAEEFTDEMTRIIELRTAGGIQPVRIFSPRGCYLIGMLARTERAKEFRKCVLDVLEGKQPVRSASKASVTHQLSAHRIRLKLLDALERERHPEKRLAIHQQLDHASRLLGLPTPALDAIGYAVAPDPVPSLVADFWEAVEFIGLDKLNHSRDPRFIAINLPNLSRLAADEKLKLPTTLEFRRVLARSEDPLYLEHNKTINSRLYNRAVKCWVFVGEQEDQ